jgi:hypothetical protein
MILKSNKTEDHNPLTALAAQFSQNLRIFRTDGFFVRSSVMSTKHGSLSPQADKRLRGGALILKGDENATIADIVEATPSAVQKWRKKLKEHSDAICCLIRKKA